MQAVRHELGGKQPKNAYVYKTLLHRKVALKETCVPGSYGRTCTEVLQRHDNVRGITTTQLGMGSEDSIEWRRGSSRLHVLRVSDKKIKLRAAMGAMLCCAMHM